MKATDDEPLLLPDPDLELDPKPIELLRAVGRSRGGAFESPIALSDDLWLAQSEVAGICSFGIFNPFGSTVWALAIVVPKRRKRGVLFLASLHRDLQACWALAIVRRPDDRDEIRSVIEAAFLHTLQEEGLVPSLGERIPPLGEGAPHWILPNPEVDPEGEITRNAFVHYLHQEGRVASVERQLDSLRRDPHSAWTRVKREVQEALAEADQLKNPGSSPVESQFRVLNGSQAEDELIGFWFNTISDREHVLRELIATAGAWDGHSTFFGSMMSDDGDDENRPFDWDSLFFYLRGVGVDLCEFSGGKLRPD